MENIILTQISLSELREIISNAVRDEYIKINAQKQTPEIEFITRKEVCEIFDISLPTLCEWTKRGHLIGYKIGTRVRYKRNEVMDSLNKILPKQKFNSYEKV